MATKNLGRSAIEGGRTGWYKVRVSEIEDSLRTSTRTYKHRVQNDVEAWENEAEPVRRPYGKRGNQTDKLAGTYRMLDKLVGKPWAKVYALICEKFDGRTLAGRHVLIDHITNYVAPNKEAADLQYHLYYIDDHGFFQKKEGYSHNRYTPHRLSKKFADKISTWLDGRSIIQMGSKLYWGVVSIKGYRAQLVPNGWFGSVVHLNYVVAVRKYFDPDWGWRQGAELSADDLEFFQTIPEYFRKQLIVEAGRKAA